MTGDLRRAAADLLTPRFLLLSLLPLLVVVPLAVVALVSLTGEATAVWRQGGGDGGWLADWIATWPWIGGLAEIGWVRGLLGLLAAVAGWLLALLAGLFLAVAVVGLLTPTVVAEVARRHYPDRVLPRGSGVGGYLRFLLRTLVVFLLLGLLVLPLLFVPGVNLLALNLPFYYWFHRLLSWDVFDAACTEGARDALPGGARTGLLARTALLYPLSLLPLLGLLLQVFFVLVLAHYALRRLAVPPAGAPA